MTHNGKSRFHDFPPEYKVVSVSSPVLASYVVLFEDFQFLGLSLISSPEFGCSD